MKINPFSCSATAEGCPGVTRIRGQPTVSILAAALQKPLSCTYTVLAKYHVQYVLVDISESK